MGPFLLVIFWTSLTVLFVYRTFFRQTKLSKFVSENYGPPKVPILGSTLEMMGDLQQVQQMILIDWPKMYGPRACASFAHWPFFATVVPDDVQTILKSTKSLDKADLFALLDFAEGGLFTMSNDRQKWQKRRKLLTPSFHWDILQNFQEIFNEQSKIFLSILQRDHDDGQPFDISPYISRLVLDIICETAMGVSIGTQIHPDAHGYLSALESGTYLFQYRVQSPWLYPNFIWRNTPSGKLYLKNKQIVEDFGDQIIKTKREELKAKQEKIQNESENSTQADQIPDFLFSKKRDRPVFIDLLLAARDDEGNGLTDKDVQGEVNTFIFGGNDTTSAALGWCYFLLACNPLEQEKVIDELDDIFGENKTRSVTTEDLSKMKYLECCLKESLRLRNPAAFVLRKSTEDLMLQDGMVVPAGINIYIPVMHIHNDPANYPEPEKYKPERWLSENSIGRHPYVFLPFSMGPRNCIGQNFAMMEMKTLLANVFRNFRLETAKTLQDIRLNIYAVVKPLDPLLITLRRREVNFDGN